MTHSWNKQKTNKQLKIEKSVCHSCGISSFESCGNDLTCNTNDDNIHWHTDILCLLAIDFVGSHEWPLNKNKNNLNITKNEVWDPKWYIDEPHDNFHDYSNGSADENEHFIFMSMLEKPNKETEQYFLMQYQSLETKKSMVMQSILILIRTKVLSSAVEI